MKNNDALAEQLAIELQWKAHTPMEFVMQPVSVFQLTAVVQLALRHPGVDGATRATAKRFLAGVRAYFSDCPAVLAVVKRGDDPNEDR